MNWAGYDLLSIWRRALLVLVAAIWGAGAAAATNETLAPYSVRMWQSDDGLPHNSVFALAQTADGYLWVGTQEGLARFDGVRFTLVETGTAPEFKHARMTALRATGDGSLWIATDGYGVLRLNKDQFSRLTEADGLPSDQARCLFESKDGALWIGSEGGLTRYRDGKLSNFSAERHGLGDNSVRAICEDRQGMLQVATRRGLSRVDKNGTITTTHFEIGSTANALRHVMEDCAGNLWVTANGGLHCVSGDSRVIYGLEQGLPDRIATVTYQDRCGQLWVGTYGGLARLTNGQAVCGPKTEAVFGDLINTIFEDRENNLWVGGRDGLYRLKPARFSTWTIQQGLTCNNVMSVCEDRAGVLWLGTWGGGLNQLLPNGVAAFTRTNGLTHDSILSLLEGRDGSLWAGMDFDGGLNRLKDGQVIAYSWQNGLINGAVRVMLEDRQGALWIGTSRGLNIRRGDRVETYTTINGLAGNAIMAFCEDGQGNIWLGTDGGLNRWRDGKFQTFSTRNGLSHNWINALYLDRDGTLWIGTRGGGLNRLKNGKFTAYTTRQGLFSDEIYDIIEDDAGHFWMSCRKGIFLVRRRDFDDLDRGASRSLNSVAFGRADDLLSVQCNGVAKPSVWKTRDGRLWFPTIRGVVAVEPRTPLNDQPPPVFIEEIVTDNVISRPPPLIGTCSNEPALQIPPGRGDLEIHYTALSLQAAEKNRFKYQLEGVDTDWVEAAGRRTAYYNNVAPGRYTFRVMACNNDGVWNQTGACLALVIAPHYWQTWWFRLAVVGAVVWLLSLLYRLRMHRLREIERLRVQIAANLHDDVGARLTKVAMMTELVDRQAAENAAHKPHIRTILNTTREVVQAMDEIVWTINPKNDTLDNLVSYIFQYAQEYFQHTGVRCRLDLPVQLPDCTVSTEQRHNLFMAVKEALNNVLKHAAATEVRVGLTVADNRLAICIADNGRGFSPAEAQGAGNGLGNMKERLEHIGGRFTLESRHREGTTISMEAPCG